MITNDGRIVYAANDVTHEITAIDTATGGCCSASPSTTPTSWC